jgi:hypothetical protein
LVALIKTETIIKRILGAMHLPTQPPQLHPPRPPPGWPPTTGALSDAENPRSKGLCSIGFENLAARSESLPAHCRTAPLLHGSDKSMVIPAKQPFSKPREAEFH